MILLGYFSKGRVTSDGRARWKGKLLQGQSTLCHSFFFLLEALKRGRQMISLLAFVPTGEHSLAAVCTPQVFLGIEFEGPLFS